MNISFTPLLSLLCGFIFFMSSCRTPKDLEFRDFKNITLDKVGFTGTTLKVDLEFYNPNNFGLELNKTDLDVFIDNNYLGHSSQNIQVAIPRRDVFTVPLVIDIDMKNLLKNGLIGLLKQEVNIRIAGKVKVGKAGVLKLFNVDYQTVRRLDMF